MSDTARTLIASSLRLLGVLASGEAASAEESTDGLSLLNDLIDSWSTQNLLIPNKVREVFTLTGGKGAYTMGLTGSPDFSSARPQKIESALIQISGSTPAVEYPMRIVNVDEFASIRMKTLSANYPQYLYNDNAFPLTTINLWPEPSSAVSLVLYSWKPLAQLTTIDTALSLPPGYQRALRYNLAIELAPEYGKALPESVTAIAAESKAEIKRMNTVPQYLECDSAVCAIPAVFDWRTGDPQ